MKKKNLVARPLEAAAGRVPFNARCERVWACNFFLRAVSLPQGSAAADPLTPCAALCSMRLSAKIFPLLLPQPQQR